MVTGIPNVGKSSLINSMRLNNLGLRNAAVKEGSFFANTAHRTYIFRRSSGRDGPRAEPGPLQRSAADLHFGHARCAESFL